ncbi:chymotrypsin-C isoform X3 [Bicyclus anynana]|nr:chymotrypsin-C isoform X3 [Bicyclus anynana]
MSPLALALLCLQLARGDGAWAPLEGLPLVSAHPCRHSRAVALWLEPGLPPARTDRYYVHVDTHIPANSVMNVTFDSAVDIILTIRSNETFSRGSLTDGDSFALRFDSEMAGLSFIVEGSTPGLTPNLTGLSINDQQYCEEPDVGYLRKYQAKEALRNNEYPWKAVIRKSNTNCGRPHLSSTPAIENGPAQPGAWPWHAALYSLRNYATKYICGGTLISKNFVLTAAHCVYNWTTGMAFPAITLTVGLGQHVLNENSSHSQVKKVERVIIHERYNNIKLFNNIALLKLSSAVSVTNFVQPACLRRGGELSAPTASDVGVVPGWGLGNDDTLSGSLQQVLLPIVSAETCVSSQPPYSSYNLDRNGFCAGYHNNGTGVCNGDSGGGLVVNIPNEKESGSGTVSGS